MNTTLGNAAEIILLSPIDNSYTSDSGDVSVGGCVVVASKGKPFAPLAIYGGTSDLENTFGKPLPKKSFGMEGLRHAHDASEACAYVNAVRAVNAKTYRFPAMTFLLGDSGSDKTEVEEWTEGEEYAVGDIVKIGDQQYICKTANTAAASNKPTFPLQSAWETYDAEEEDEEETAAVQIKKSAHAYDEEIVCGDDAVMTLYVVDGDASTNRYITISKIDDENERFKINLYDLDDLGEPYQLESRTVSVDQDGLDDMGVSSYIETVFEQNSSYLRADCGENLTWKEVKPLLESLAEMGEIHFEGGTSGDDPDTDDFITAATVFDNERVACDLLFAAGNYDQDFIAYLAQIADSRRIAFFFDVPPSINPTSALAWIADLGMSNRHARAYYSPYSANDQWRGGKCVWGVSGAMAAAKARCNAISTVTTVPGMHYAPAGETRGYLTRTGLTSLYPEHKIERELFYDARLNPIMPMTSGGCCCDDDLTQWFKESYLRFGWVNDVLDYLDHRFLSVASEVKFLPDDLTKTNLADLFSAVLDKLVTSGALVAPRDPDRDGTDPYKLTIEQETIDQWKVLWAVCITGAARRIVGQSEIVK